MDLKTAITYPEDNFIHWVLWRRPNGSSTVDTFDTEVQAFVFADRKFLDGTLIQQGKSTH